MEFYCPKCGYANSNRSDILCSACGYVWDENAYEALQKSTKQAQSASTEKKVEKENEHN